MFKHVIYGWLTYTVYTCIKYKGSLTKMFTLCDLKYDFQIFFYSQILKCLSGLNIRHQLGSTF